MSQQSTTSILTYSLVTSTKPSSAKCDITRTSYSKCVVLHWIPSTQHGNKVQKIVCMCSLFNVILTISFPFTCPTPGGNISIWNSHRHIGVLFRHIQEEFKSVLYTLGHFLWMGDLDVKHRIGIVLYISIHDNVVCWDIFPLLFFFYFIVYMYIYIYY